MAFIQMTCFSNMLHMTVNFDVILPQSVSGEIGIDSSKDMEKYPVLWLLHGATDDHTTWQRRTSIERYAAPLGLAVVMPNGHLSSYMNMAHGGRFYDFIAKELPETIYKVFPISDKRKDNFIAGNSMGGFGAMMIGINNPDRYEAIGCFSAAAGNGRPHISKATDTLFNQDIRDNMQFLQYGDKDLKNTEWDTMYMAEKNKTLPELPRIFHSIGKDDFLIEQARQTRDFFQKMEGNPYQYVYEEHEGIHGWDYWDLHITDFLNFLQLKQVDRKIAN
jgi:putative tributyrin esterase